MDRLLKSMNLSADFRQAGLAPRLPVAGQCVARLLGMTLLTGWLVCLLACPSCAFQSDEIEREEPELIDQEAFDLIRLTSAAGGEAVKVFPLPFPGRELPSGRRPTDRLSCVLVRFPDREYEILWRDIETIELYERQVYQEAVQRMDDKDFIGAFQNLSYLMKHYPDLKGLDSLHYEFMLRSAVDRFTAGDVAQTLSALEELHDIAPNFKTPTVINGLSQAADAIAKAYQQNGDLTSAKAVLNRLQQQYGNEIPVVGQWQRRLEGMARAKMDEALKLMEAGEFRKARSAAVDMLGILPDFEAGKDLIDEINRTHPMVRVGVMQKSGELDPASLINWPSRRAGQLVAQPLFQFLETGSEGGTYRFALGSFRISDDRQQLALVLDPNVSFKLDAFGLAQELVDRADAENPKYDPSWAAIVQEVSVASPTQIDVQLKRPNVLPHALLQWIIEDAASEYALPGPYVLAAQDTLETSFRVRQDTAQPGQPVEVVEVFYEDPRQAVNDLLRGEIDVLDQVYPADAQRLAVDSRLMVGSYSLPTVHMLIPVSDDPYLANAKFRRALMYATNRQGMLSGELLDSDDLNDGRLVSGPFPLGDGRSDLLAYAYDAEVEPIGYSPQLAQLLRVMATDEVSNSFTRRRKAVPKLRKLVLGCPDFEFARVAVQGMIQQWAIVGIEVEMLVLPPGQLFDDAVECDLLYVMTTMWEPATDIERLLGGDGLAASDNPFIVQGLEGLRAARNWREVRNALQKLHQLVDYHLPILPLWQVTDRFVVRRNVSGLEDKPVSLYQNVAQWRIDLGNTAAER